MRRYFKNARGQVVGWTDEINGIEQAHDRQGRLVGWYNRKTDHTHDSSGRLVTTSGDATSRLIFDEEDEE